jgi:hypothetical protein
LIPTTRVEGLVGNIRNFFSFLGVHKEFCKKNMELRFIQRNREEFRRIRDLLLYYLDTRGFVEKLRNSFVLGETIEGSVQTIQNHFFPYQVIWSSVKKMGNVLCILSSDDVFVCKVRNFSLFFENYKRLRMKHPKPVEFL